MKAILEKISHQDQSAVTAFSFDEENFLAPWHYHPEFELTCILESEGIRYVGNHISEYQPMDLVLLGADLPHRWKNTGHSGSRARSLVIQWKKEMLPEIADLSSIHALLTRAKRGVFFRKETSEQLLPLMQAILAPEVNKYIQLLKILQKLSQVMDDEFLSGEDFSPDLSLKTGYRLDVVQQYIEQHYREKITLSSMAALVNMREESFSRFFSRVMKKPFFSFLNEYRVNRACKLLIETDQNVSEVGFCCGYDSLPFFYKQFKRIKGYSPLVFRKIYHAEKLGKSRI